MPSRMVFRAVNEQIVSLFASFGLDGETALVCECGEERCTSRIELTRDEFETIRAKPLRFVVAPGHDDEHPVVHVTDRYAVVEA